MLYVLEEKREGKVSKTYKREKVYPYWKKVERDQFDKERGFNLCPICEKDSCEYLIDLDEGEETSIKERCKNGCFVVSIP